MKINEGISTAVGRPLESFPLLAAHFPSGGRKKTGQKACCAAVTQIERARYKKASKCFFYLGLSGNVSEGGINEQHKRLLLKLFYPSLLSLLYLSHAPAVMYKVFKQALTAQNKKRTKEMIRLVPRKLG